MRMKKLFSLFLITLLAGSDLSYAKENPTPEFKECIVKETINRKAVFTATLTAAQKEILTIILPAIETDNDYYKPYWEEYYSASEKWLAENEYDYAEYDKASRNFPHAQKLAYFGSAYNRFFQLVNEGVLNSSDPKLQSKIDQFCEKRAGEDPFCLDLKHFLKSTIKNILDPDFTADAKSHCLKETVVDTNSIDKNETNMTRNKDL